MRLNFILLKTTLAFIVWGHAFCLRDGISETFYGATWELTDLFWDILRVDNGEDKGEGEEEILHFHGFN